jgi:hypothetical protein
MGLNLTPSEMRFIQTYRKLDDDTQELFAETIEAISEEASHRRPGPKPALRLVANRANCAEVTA